MMKNFYVGVSIVLVVGCVVLIRDITRDPLPYPDPLPEEVLIQEAITFAGMKGDVIVHQKAFMSSNQLIGLEGMNRTFWPETLVFAVLLEGQPVRVVYPPNPNESPPTFEGALVVLMADSGAVIHVAAYHEMDDFSSTIFEP